MFSFLSSFVCYQNKSMTTYLASKKGYFQKLIFSVMRDTRTN
jgi:hypothetical protein